MKLPIYNAIMLQLVFLLVLHSWHGKRTETYAEFFYMEGYTLMIKQIWSFHLEDLDQCL